MDDKTRVALECIKAQYPEWNVYFNGGRRPMWIASRIFDAPAVLIYVECFSVRALHARMMANEWIVTPKIPLRAQSQDIEAARTPSTQRARTRNAAFGGSR